ncbi:hypothetical protein [Pandoraea apista]|uniref:hypothetical protein n=1 Tax=Pandoraea apista TaxID=93218 RepID=UPI000F66744A|nr:hypothetical protein [Pandoraea apista]RRW94274.1 hypothetical protein EGJ54_18210 [Pandoraea apista]RRX00632.1 hypothetical protein EGJ56_18855 [Pandoraea apista]
MSQNPVGNSESEQLEVVLSGVDNQIRHHMDSVRARKFWLKVLSEVPAETVAQALSMALSGGQYQAVPRCNCCCKRA